LIEKSICIFPVPQPPSDASHWVIALDDALTGSASTAVFHGSVAWKSPVPPPALPEELLLDELDATLLDATLLDATLLDEEEVLELLVDPV
jgi:hypothetical protein